MVLKIAIHIAINGPYGTRNPELQAVYPGVTSSQ